MRFDWIVWAPDMFMLHIFWVRKINDNLILPEYVYASCFFAGKANDIQTYSKQIWLNLIVWVPNMFIFLFLAGTAIILSFFSPVLHVLHHWRLLHGIDTATHTNLHIAQTAPKRKLKRKDIQTRALNLLISPTLTKKIDVWTSLCAHGLRSSTSAWQRVWHLLGVGPSIAAMQSQTWETWWRFLWEPSWGQIFLLAMANPHLFLPCCWLCGRIGGIYRNKKHLENIDFCRRLFAQGTM